MGSWREQRWRNVCAEIEAQRKLWPESTYRSKALGQEEVSRAMRPDGPDKVLASGARAVALKAEECQPFSNAHVEFHLRLRSALLHDFGAQEEETADEMPVQPPPVLRPVQSAWTRPADPKSFPRSQASPCRSERRERMHKLEQDILDHDEGRLAEVASGTFPLLGARGQPLLPVPPLPVETRRIALPQRLRLATSNKTAKGSKRYELMASHIWRDEASDVPLRTVAHEAMEGEGFDAAAPWEPVPPFPKPAHELSRTYDTAAALLKRAEELLVSNAAEDQWVPLTWRMASEAYTATLQEVLRIVRLLGHLARKRHGLSAATKKDMKLLANSTLNSLTHRLAEVTMEAAVEVLETMGAVHVGSQVFLNLLMTTLLAHHHRDSSVPSEAQSLRLSKALAQLQLNPKLSPRGRGATDLTDRLHRAPALTNQKILKILSERLPDEVRIASPEEMATLEFD
mmetsp:Transcript_41846/g.97441  ORF Transcript_41846/g.97441 Transcript_41846/m.97441 type:complete len:457 (-) Transcript_41846:31-1401(-)